LLDVRLKVLVLVLCEQTDAAEAGVEAVGQGEVDNPKYSTEWDGRFVSGSGQWMKAFASSAGHD
jgi:hypothetical protein